MAEAALCEEVKALKKLVTDAESGTVHVARMVLEETATRLLLKLDATPFRDKALRKSLITLVENLVPELDADDHATAAQIPAQVPAQVTATVPAPPTAPVTAQVTATVPAPPAAARSRKRSRRDESLCEAASCIGRCRLVVRDRASGRACFVGTDGRHYWVVKHEVPFFRDIPCFAMEPTEDDAAADFELEPVGYAVMFGGYGEPSNGKGRAFCDQLKGTCWHRKDPCLFRIMSRFAEGAFGAVPIEMALVDSPQDWSALEMWMGGFERDRGAADMYKRVVRSLGCEPSWKAAEITTQTQLEEYLEQQRQSYQKGLALRR